MAAGGAVRGAALGTAVRAPKGIFRRGTPRGCATRPAFARAGSVALDPPTGAAPQSQPWGGAMNRTRALIGVPFVALLWVPLYARLRPEWLGIPCFYWYLFGWVGVTAAINAWVYYKARDPR